MSEAAGENSGTTEPKTPPESKTPPKEKQEVAVVEENSEYTKDVISQLERTSKTADLTKSELCKIEGIEFLKMTETLLIRSNLVKKINNLYTLTTLKELDLCDNQLKVIENLDTLYNMEILDLSSNEILKIENVDKLKNLKVLKLGCNKIKKIEGLDKLENLEHLELGCNRITTIENLQNNTNLQRLYLNSNKIKSIENICQLKLLKNLVELNISSNLISSIEGLTELPQLKMIFLSHNFIQKIEGLEKSENLEYMNVDYNQIEEINNVGHLKALTDFSAKYNKMSILSTPITPGTYLRGLKTFAPNVLASAVNSLKETEIGWSKVAVLAVLAVGVEEYYFSRIYKNIQKRLEKTGQKYECSRKEKLEFVWIFNYSGLYAAAVHKSNWFLFIIIYDCMGKKAYEYLRHFTELQPDYLYWFNGHLILVHIDQNNCIQQIKIRIDHENRRADIIETRNYDFPFVINENGWNHKAYMNNLKTKPLVECVETAILYKEEYIVLPSLSGITTVLIPKDPNSTLQLRTSLYLYPVDEHIRVTGVNFQILHRMCHQEFLYAPKMCEASWRNQREQKYILDGFIEINLKEQKNVQGQFLDMGQKWSEQDQSGNEVLFSHAGSVPKDVAKPRSVLSAKRFGNGKVLAVVGNDKSKTYSCLIDAKRKQITWRKWEPNIQRKSNMILSSLIPVVISLKLTTKRSKKMINISFILRLLHIQTSLLS